MIRKYKEKLQGEPVTLAILALIVGAFSIGVAPILVRLSEVGPASTAFWRILLVLPLFYFMMGRQVKSVEATSFFQNKKVAWGVFLCGFLFAADLAVWHWSLQFTSVANATLLPNLMPIVVAIGAYFLFGERLTKTFFMGLMLAIGGAIVLTGGGGGEGRLLGDSLALLTAVIYGLYLLNLRWVRLSIRTSVIMFWSGVVSVLFLMPIAFLSGEVFLPTNMDAWLVLIGLGLISQFLGQGMITYSLAHLPSSFGAVTLLVQPVVAAAIAWPLFGEVLSAKDLIAIAIVLAGIYLARLGSVESKKS